MEISFLDNLLLPLTDALKAKKNVSVFGLSFGEKAVFLCNQKRPVVFVTSSASDADKLCAQMQSFGKSTKIIFAPEVEHFSIGKNLADAGTSQSIDALFSMLQNKVDCLIVSPSVLMQKFPKHDILSQNAIKLKVGGCYDLSKLIQSLIVLGYKRVEQVAFCGEFSVKGDTLLLFEFSAQKPFKVEFFDNQIETMYQFDIETYKKEREVRKLCVLPATLTLIDGKDKQKIFELVKADYELTAKALDANEAIKLKTNFEEFKINFDAGNFDCVKNWIVPFADYDKISDYFLPNTLLVFDDVKQIYESIKNEYQQFFDMHKNLLTTGEVLHGQKKLLVPFESVFEAKCQMLSFQQITSANRIFEPTAVQSFKSSAETKYLGNYKLLVEDMLYYMQYGYTVIISTGSKTTSKFLQEYLQKNDIDAICTSVQDIKAGSINILDDEIPFGAIFLEDKVVIVGTKELLKKSTQKKVAVTEKKEEFTLPSVGDYVVHENFGIGVCIGIEKLKFSDYQKDYIILQYADGDKLYLPTEQIGLISAYVSGGKAPKLNKLGTKDFEATKAKVKSSLKKLAFSLVQLYKERELAKGFKFEVDKNLFEQFSNDFAYDETPDQTSAIASIVKDMTSGKVMDRIVCGDVGYGKTEVALRAIFISALNGKQTAFLAPTTVLSQQHFTTAKSRLENYGIVVECLNRFKSKAEQTSIVKRLKEGKIDVICGTHRLLSKDVAFKDLGLLVLDEEQRFGVGDKEKIKRLKTDVDVLTLSATPIPRTLHMGLVGIRDIDVIATAPQGRLPVQTVVAEYGDAMLANAISREISRGGQVLIIYNRVETIYSLAKHVREVVQNNLMTDVQIGVAHGQMTSKELEEQMIALYQGKTQILISTTLIENGIDLPSANTLFVIDADKLGLSQLYQLKGRVGRSKNLGYAYFTFDRSKALSEDAYKRLNAIMEFTELGSGFKIAMKDLEIRGCGNILGAEQSGHMAKVGYDMYCKILNEAVAEIKGQSQKAYKDIKLNVALNCYIPENFIDGSENRFRIYSNLKSINSSKSKGEVLSEIEGLYGKVPAEIENLACVALLRNLAREFDVKQIAIDRQRCTAEFYDKQSMLNKNLASALKQHSTKVYFASDGATMNFMLSEYSVKHKLEILCKIFETAFSNLKNSN